MLRFSKPQYPVFTRSRARKVLVLGVTDINIPRSNER